MLKGNFRASQSPFFKGLGYIPICLSCLNYFEKKYTELLGSNDEAIRRLALHLDLYLNESLLDSSRKINVGQSRIAGYIANANLNQYANRTYDDYLFELAANAKIESVEDLKEQDNTKVTQKMLRFWGTGFHPDDYLFLADKYNDWTSRHECKTKAQESIFQKICLMELQIIKATQGGDKNDKVASLIKAFNDLLASANIKPVQNKDNSLADQNTFGTLIQKWENEKPIPEAEPEWKDVDGISKYIAVWFKGHMCKMLGIKNSYSDIYEKEISKYTVSKPQYEEDADVSFDDIFGMTGETGGADVAEG